MMEYRKLGRTGLEVSVIGLGTEHLVQTKKNMQEVLRMAVDAGVNYVDVLYSNPEVDSDFWNSITSELNHYRDKLILMAHWGPSDMYPDPAICQHNFDLALKCMDDGYFDGVMLTVVDSEKTWNGWARESLERLKIYKEQGRIGYIGLSGHSTPVAIMAAQSGLVDVLMFPVNILDHDNEKIKALYNACSGQNTGLVGMKVYNGGTILSVKGKPSGITPVQCLHYALSQPVATVVPGARNAEEMQRTLHYLTAADEEKDYSAIPANLHELLAGQCTYCQHCLPCPQQIGIPWILWHLDQVDARGVEWVRNSYAGFPVKASACVECGECISRCPFNVEIITRMHEATALLENVQK